MNQKVIHGKSEEKILEQSRPAIFMVSVAGADKGWWWAVVVDWWWEELGLFYFMGKLYFARLSKKHSV